ncbi:DUF4268 domain-containing protein [Herbivorax sp. ANBcel31]|uniref:DUF4268 domain-containing protein n=1 Tax=Herbivorax sp. ANBcel31 TaxID=3069754 RepID=UPI0027AE2D20|nr:DUF4268 domain-containing protein [Herbivorax sp. ANBcel31]MDQ2088070.1 DUF4268 domain-containing protein [Herbivorax sp. ANBcel31]
MYKLNIDNNSLEKVKETSFADNEIKERSGIEEWIRKDPTILEEDLLIIAHEYDKFEVNERLDLLALDKEGNTVIIEVKRDQTGSNVDFQALKYCSYCSTLTPNDIVETYKEYLNKFGKEENPIENLLDFLELDAEDMLNGILNTGQRIIIIGKTIDKRILSVCAWLYQNNIDVKCMTIVPYKEHIAGQVFIDINQLIPLFTTEDYFINKKKKDTSKGKVLQSDEVINFFEGIIEIAKKRGFNISYSPRKPYAKIYTGIRGLFFAIVYKKRNSEFSIEVSANNQQIKEELFSVFEENKTLIQSETGLDYEVQKEGVRNPEWGRVITVISHDNKYALSDYIQEVGKKFVDVTRIFIDKWNKD